MNSSTTTFTTQGVSDASIMLVWILGSCLSCAAVIMLQNEHTRRPYQRSYRVESFIRRFIASSLPYNADAVQRNAEQFAREICIEFANDLDGWGVGDKEVHLFTGNEDWNNIDFSEIERKRGLHIHIVVGSAVLQ